MTDPLPSSSDLCVACGLCCGDAMFSHINLEEGERDRLRQNGYPPELMGEATIPLPCPMLRGTSCSIYANRPHVCASYRCEVLKAVEQNDMEVAQAFAHVRQAKALLDRLRELMPEAVSLPLAREKWNREKTAGQPLDPETAAAQLAFYAYYAYMDRHFRRPAKWLVTRNPEVRPDGDEPS